MRPAALALVVALAGAGPGTFACAGDGACTEIGCEDEATVLFPLGLVDGAYDLVVTGDGGTITARCNDPDAPEAEQNPPELECDSRGFTLVGHDLARTNDLLVTVTRVATGEDVVDNAAVLLATLETHQPNGPDCPPTCFVREGSVPMGG
jgi:hypothetical protein